jgi:phytoene synthase
MLDHDRKVALEQLPREVRPAFAALWDLDLAFADVVSTSSDLRLGAIRLAWWRERLDELDRHPAAPAEPRLQTVAKELLPRGLSGHELTGLEDAWLPLLEPFPWSKAQAEGLALRGRVLFGVGARLLGCSADEAERAGAFWSLADGAQHCSDASSRELLVGEAREALGAIGGHLPHRLRPLTVLAALAAVDLFRDASGMARLSVAFRHRLTGGLPHS